MTKLKESQVYTKFIQFYLYIRWLFSNKKNHTPHIVKQRVIKKWAAKSRIENFIETGTYKGDMVYAVRDKFKKIYSIELADALAEMAKIRFRNDKHITIIKGNSSIELPKLLNVISDKCIFWLDGHYSTGNTARGFDDSPIKDELDIISGFKCKADCVILIDDARLFVGSNGYPVLSAVIEFLEKKIGHKNIVVKNDIIISSNM